MKNLEQIRARNAYNFAQSNEVRGQNDGEIVKKIPPLIMNHGLLAVLGYASDKKNMGYKVVCDGIAEHLSDPDIGCVSKDAATHELLLKSLTSGSDANSQCLRMATAEAMAWLNFARRFVKKNPRSDTPS